MKIGFLPIDNRPICYTLPKIISQIDESIEFFIPDRKYLGDLTKYADVEELFRWLKSLPSLDALILSLDTIAYGGLISSRRCSETFEQIKTRIEYLKEILEEKDCKIYAFSSIMRISNNNYNIEEKEYWEKYGKKIFEYSYNLHKNSVILNSIQNPEFIMSKDIPQDILNDYLSTRKRNFEINKIYLKWQKEGLFDTLIFSKDDCAEYGLNVKEAQELENMGGFTKTGADEIPLSLLSRAIQGNIKICPIFLEPDYKNLISNYEDISIENSVKGQIELAGCSVSNRQDADILLYVNNFKKQQGEIVMGVNTENFAGEFAAPDKPYMIADVRFANGADNNFVEELFKNKIEDKFFFGYSAWNTSANTLGSLICGAKVKFLATKYNAPVILNSIQNLYNQEAFKKLQITRFLDDWAYQANVRQQLHDLNIETLKSSMKNYEIKISEICKSEVKVSYIYPWNRLFEVEIEFN